MYKMTLKRFTRRSEAKLRKILVTGGAGFVGSHVAEFYAKKKDEVVVFDNLSRMQLLKRQGKNAVYNWKYLKQYRNIELVNGDIRNSNHLERMGKDVDIMVHAAAQTAVTTSLIDPKTDFTINARGTFNVLETARKSEKNPVVIFCSTNKVYGDNVNKIGVKEEKTRYRFADEQFKDGIAEDFPIDLCGHTPYGCSKLTGDMYAQDYAHNYGLKTGVFRMSCVYGERQFGVEDQGWLAWFVIATLTNKPIMIYGNGKQVRDVLYVADLVNAFDAFISSNLRQGVFNIGGGPENTLSILELLDLLEKLVRKPSVSFADWRHADQKVYVSDISKVRQKLGWEPAMSPREGAKKLVKWVSENIGLFD